MKRLFILLLVWGYCHATEFLYPVAPVSNSDYLLLIYQKTPHHIELWQWDVHTKQAETVLLSRYTPAGLRLLPNNRGYSFIDNGRIRIKKWAKRSPRNIELDGPICNIELINWIDELTCYTSGKYQDCFGIFQVDDEGTVCPIAVDAESDFMYPQKIDDTLFFIIRDKYRQYHIATMLYHAHGKEYDEFYDRIHSHVPEKPDTIVDCGLQPIVFLQMITQREGFYLAHPRAISKKDRYILFSYHHLTQQEEVWKSEQLIVFSIPTSLLFTGKESRLYEALLPLVPQYEDGSIFYSDCAESEYLTLYRYCLEHGKNIQISPDREQHHFFAPVFSGRRMYYGGKLCDQLDGAIRMDIVDGYIRVLLGSLLW